MTTTKYKLFLLVIALVLFSAIFMGVTCAYAEETCVHNFTFRTVNATCNEYDYTEYTCESCGYSYKTDYIQGEHEYKTATIEPTCTHKGYTTHFCVLCGYSYTDNYVDETGHEFVDETVQADCLNNGYTTHTCTKCSYEYTDNYVEKLGHNYEGVTTDADCLNGGFTTYTCTRCNDSYVGDNVDALGHDYLDETINANCVSYGYTTHTCSRCQDRYVTDYVAPTGHDYIEEKILSAKDGIGYIKHTCKNCSYSYVSEFIVSDKDGFPPDVAHKHSYYLQTVLNENNKTVKFSYLCDCGDDGINRLVVKTVDEKAALRVETLDNGIMSYVSYTGKIRVEVSDGDKLLNYFYIQCTEIATEPEVHQHNYVYSIDKDLGNKEISVRYVCECGASEKLAVEIDNGAEIKTYDIESGETVNYADIYGALIISIKHNAEVLETFEVENLQDIEEHEHQYSFEYRLDKNVKTITVKCSCVICGESIKVDAEFKDKDGYGITITADGNGAINYGELNDGEYEVRLINGQTDFAVFELDIQSEPVVPDEPNEPIEPDEPFDPMNPFEPQEPTGSRRSNGTFAIVMLVVVLVGLIAGGIATVVMMKKKKK